MEINKELLMMNHFCKGIKHGYKYECGNEADEEVKNVAIELLTEAIKRMLRWQIWNDWWINEYRGKWLEAKISIEEKLRGKYSGEIVNTLSGLIDEIINYMDNKLGKYWLSNNVGNEIKELIEYVKMVKLILLFGKKNQELVFMTSIQH
ncbi:hypothetical protein [Vulcanisaeta sp. JCM 14467]|uniref:hypothetical protein n=1 Tax=Vulcanisaeta sp. JCM 14467 TaxID=1295370 RepID=UPI002092BC1E|nr:hypothetical protein [Vulcanisaeta sp. JCM 14467]